MVQQHLVYLVWIIKFIFFVQSSDKQFYYDINKTLSDGSTTTTSASTTIGIRIIITIYWFQDKLFECLKLQIGFQ